MTPILGALVKSLSLKKKNRCTQKPLPALGDKFCRSLKAANTLGGEIQVRGTEASVLFLVIF